MSRRDTGPLIRKFRKFLLGRKIKGHHRFEPDLSERTQPLPDLPVGPASKLCNNYYFTRDPRREVTRPTVIIDTSKKLIESKNDECQEGKNKEKSSNSKPSKKTKLPTPGKLHKY